MKNPESLISSRGFGLCQISLDFILVEGTPTYRKTVSKPALLVTP